MENHSAPSAPTINQVYRDFYENYRQPLIDYWKSRSRMTNEELEDIISDGIQEHFKQVSEAIDPQRILNCPYLLGIIRNKIYAAFREQCVRYKDDDFDDDDLPEPTTMRGNAPRVVYIEEFGGNLNDDGEYTGVQFRNIEYQLSCEEQDAPALEHYRRRMHHRLYELLHMLDHNHELLFRYHYGLGVPKLTFAEIAPLTGFSSADSAKVVFDRKKKLLIKLAHAA